MTWAAAAGLAVVLAGIGAAVYMNDRVESASPKALRRVAVIPFADRTGSPDGPVIVAGLSELIGARIIQSDQIEVVPALDTGGAGPAAVARKRGASLAVHGSIQRSGDQLRVHFGVTEAASGRQVAANTITGSSSELFRLQDAVVEGILTALEARSGAPLDERSVPVELTSPADQNAYIEALGLLQRSADRESVDRAITILTRLLKVARDSAPLNAQLARALVNKSQLTRTPALVEQAMIYAERAAEIDGALPESHIRLGQAQVAAGKYADAAKSFERALALRRDNADAVLGLGTANEGMGRGAEAEKMYRKAISLRPDHANTFNRYAGFLYWEGRYDEAAANFARFNELLPTARGFSNLGETYMALGRYDDAEKACSQSVSIEPTTDAYICLGSVRFHAGKYAEACTAFEKATELAPDWYVAWAGLGDACRWSPDRRDRAQPMYEQAIVSANKALGINPKDALAHALAASSMAKLGRHDRAAESINTALKMNPTSPDVLHAAAVVAQLKGNPDAAIHWIERAVDVGYSVPNLERDPEFRPLHQDPSFRGALKKRP